MSIPIREDIVCPECGRKSAFTLWETLNGDLDPEAKQQLIDGSLFTFQCPNCGHEAQVNYPILYHDMKHETMVYFVNDDAAEKTKEMFLGTLGKSRFQMPNYKKRIVTNQNVLREKAIIFDNELDDRVIEVIKLLYLANAQAQFADAHISAVYFLIDDGKYKLQFMGDQILSAIFERGFYDHIEAMIAGALTNGDEVFIDSAWAQRALKECSKG